MNLLNTDVHSGRLGRLALIILFLLIVIMLGAPALGRAAAQASLSYSTFLGGSITDEGKSVAVDKNGNIYILGRTYSEDFLGFETPIGGYSDLYVAKFDPSGENLHYLVTIGGNDSEVPVAIAADAQGNAYVTGLTFSDDFPLKDPLWATWPHYTHDGLLFKLDAGGDLVYSTLLPLDLFDSYHNVAVDAAGNAYVTGTSFQPNEYGNQIALLKIGPSGKTLLLDELIGGPDVDKGMAVALDAAGNIYLAGQTSNGGRDSFPVTANAHQAECGDMLYGDNFYCYEDAVVVVLNPAGDVTYSSYHGGSFTEDPVSIGVDGHGNILIAGNTASSVFPLANPVQAGCPVDEATENCYSDRGFVSLIKLDDAQSSLIYSTYLGSMERASTTALKAAAITPGGQATVVGYTNARQFPTAAPLQPELATGFCYTFSSQRFCFDNFVTTFSPTGALSFSTYLGGALDEFGFGVALGNNGAIYLTGQTESMDFPTTAKAFQPNKHIGDDGFLTKIDSGVAPPPPPPPPLGDYNGYVPLIIR